MGRGSVGASRFFHSRLLWLSPSCCGWPPIELKHIQGDSKHWLQVTKERILSNQPSTDNPFAPDYYEITYIALYGGLSNLCKS